MIRHYGSNGRRADKQVSLGHDPEKLAERTISADAVLKGEQELYIVRRSDRREREEMEGLLRDSSNGIYLPTDPYVIERIGHIWSELGKWGKTPIKGRWAYNTHGDYSDAVFYYTLYGETQCSLFLEQDGVKAVERNLDLPRVREDIIASAHTSGTIKRWRGHSFKMFTSELEARKFIRQQTIADGLAAGLDAFIQDADLPEQVIVKVTEHHKTNEPILNRAYGTAQRSFRAAVDAGSEHRTFKLQYGEDGFPTISFSSMSTFM